MTERKIPVITHLGGGASNSERFVLPSNFLLASSPILYTDLKAQMTKSKEQDHDRVFAQTGRWVP